MSNYEQVCEFTRAAGDEIPEKPRAMSPDTVVKLTKMVMSELQEFVDTVTSSSEESVSLLKSCIGVDQNKHPSDSGRTLSEVEVIAEQSDALVDAWYYMLNFAGRHGQNLSRVFDVVHAANMAKVNPETGKVVRRPEDGKILKPEGWTAPDIVEEIRRQGYSQG